MKHIRIQIDIWMVALHISNHIPSTNVEAIPLCIDALCNQIRNIAWGSNGTKFFFRRIYIFAV